MPEIQGVLVDKITNLYKLKAQLKKKYDDAEFETIGEKPTPRNFLHVMIKEALSLLTQQSTGLR